MRTGLRWRMIPELDVEADIARVSEEGQAGKKTWT